jgi:hypothetical protein
MDWKLQVLVVLPVSDVDGAKVTPRGSACSIIFGQAAAAPVDAAGNTGSPQRTVTNVR